LLGHLTDSVPPGHAAGLSGLFNTATRAGGVVGTAAFGSVYLALDHEPGAQAVRSFAAVNLALALTALASALLAALAIRGR